MHFAFRLLAFIAVLSPAIASDDGNEVCSVYLAETSLPNAREQWGVYAGKEFVLGDRLPSGGLAIQIIDFTKKFMEQMVAEHTVSPKTVGGDMEGYGVGTILPGITNLINYHSVLHNVVIGGATQDSILDRYSDPGAGAFTSYHDTPVYATRPIKKGEELFLRVGNDWFVNKELPREGDYNLVDNVMEGVMNLLNSNPTTPETVLRDILRRIRREILTSEAWADKPYLATMIPKSIDGLKDVATRGSARAELVDRHFTEEDSFYQNGYCLDNIVAGRSNIAQAGRGAFAHRSLKEGQVIVPVPLLHFSNEDDLSMHEGNDRKDLLVNYCFGHEKSSLLLCPLTSASLVNHSNSPNAKIVWAEEESFRDYDWRSATIDELHNTYSSVLMFNLIATRDIEKGDEIFIDYGRDWERAWNTHVAHWKPPEPPKSSNFKYIPSSQLNAEKAKIYVDVVKEYPNHLYLCRVEPNTEIEPETADIPVTDYDSNPSINPENWADHLQVIFDRGQMDHWWPCDVVEADENNEIFVTKIYEKLVELDQNGYLVTAGRVVRLVKNTPRHAIQFVDRPYHSDQHLERAFRQKIGIPSDIFPLHWRTDYVDGKIMNNSWNKENWDPVDESTENEHSESLRAARCGLYYAPSTIAAAGKGIYVGVDVKAQVNVESTIPPIVIPDINWNTTDETIRWDALDYTWDGSAYGAEFECTRSGKHDSQVLAVDIGMMANFHPGLVNSLMGPSSFSPLYERNRNPGSGASSDYFQHTFKANRDIKMGSEVFISYGETWFEHREHLRNIPLLRHYHEANVIASSVIALATGPRVTGLSPDVIEQLWDVVKRVVVADRTSTVVDRHKTYDDLMHILVRKGTEELETNRRSLEWLEEHGECIDHIYVQDSTLEHATRGAFARRYIAKGDVIISSPMLNNWGRQRLNMFTNRTGVEGESNGKQLIYNYVFGHPDSNILMFPVTRAITINHKSNRTKYNDDGSKNLGPNAFLRWSKSNRKTQYYLRRHISDLRQEKYATIILEFVASRDINPDEEIFIDYGIDWEKAWNAHMTNFYEKEYGKGQFSSKSLVDINGDKMNKDYHQWTDNYFNVCMTMKIPDHDTDEWIEILPNDQGSFGVNYEHVGYDLMRDGISWCPCIILNINDENHMDVAIFAVSTENTSQRFIRRVRYVHNQYVEFRPMPARSDQHWTGAFRHEIGIPDEIFPELWKDISLEDLVPSSLSSK